MGRILTDLMGALTRGIGLRISLSFLPPIALAWTFFILYTMKLLEQGSDRLWLTVILGLFAIAIGSLVVIWLILTTIPPIRHMIDVTGALARGELSTEIPYQDRSDETGELGRALHIFKQNVVELEGVAAIKSEKEGDISKKRELLSLADALEGEVEGTIKQVMGQAEAMTRSTEEAAQAIRRMEGLYKSLTAASDETQVNVNAVASATDELASARSPSR